MIVLRNLLENKKPFDEKGRSQLIREMSRLYIWVATENVRYIDDGVLQEHLRLELNI